MSYERYVRANPTPGHSSEGYLIYPNHAIYEGEDRGGFGYSFQLNDFGTPTSLLTPTKEEIPVDARRSHLLAPSYYLSPRRTTPLQKLREKVGLPDLDREYHNKYFTPLAYAVHTILASNWTEAEEKMGEHEGLPPLSDARTETIDRQVWELVDEWADSLKSTNSASVRSVCVGEQGESTSFMNIRIGEGAHYNDPSSWNTEEKIASAFQFAKDTLGLKQRRPAIFYTLGTTDEYNTREQVFINVLYNLIGTYGFALPKPQIVVFVEPSRIRRLSNYMHVKAVSHERYPWIMAHEVGHLIDPNWMHATKPQREGFAVAMESEFSFPIAKHYLRSISNRVITQLQIEASLGKEPPEKFGRFDSYAIPGTFYVHLFETMGAHKFLRWYALVSGSESAYLSPGNYWVTLPDSVWSVRGERPASHTGDVVGALAVVNQYERSPEKRAQQIMKEYLERVNT